MATIIDLDQNGTQTNNGHAVEYGTNQAIKNSLVAYLTSKTGDYVKYPGFGGTLEKILFKNINDLNKSKFEYDINKDLTNNYGNYVSIRSVELTPVYNSRYWSINIYYTVNITNYSDTIQLYYQGIQESQSQQLKEIPFEGDNLKNFVTIALIDMAGKKLIYDVDLSKWVWGNIYIFTNFSDASSNFSEICNMINTGVI